MGYGIAQSCLRGQITTYGVDVATERMDKFMQEGGERGSIDDAVASLDAVVIAVLNAEQTESVLFGTNALVPRMKEGAVVISCATVPPEFAVSMEKACASHDVHYLDAPISGGSVKAANGQLTIMASGTPKTFEAARPVLDAVAEKVFELGDKAGPGSAMKAVNQLLAGVHIASMAEAITFTSWMLENRAPHVVEGDYSPHSQVNIWLKDLGIVLDIAKSSKFSAPITAAALQQYIVAAGQGLGLEDDAAIAKVYARNVGISLPGDD